MSGVVVHLSEAGTEHQAAVLRNVLNLRADLGPDEPVELVVHGAGVALLTGESGLDEEVRTLNLAGVRALACLNTLASRGLTPDDLLPEAGTVSSGVGHLARRQLKGWAYLRL
jgi:hypothetical protein